MGAFNFYSRTKIVLFSVSEIHLIKTVFIFLNRVRNLGGIHHQSISKSSNKSFLWEIFDLSTRIYKKRKTEKKTRKKIIKRVSVRHKENLGDMATQLALQRNFVTITPSNQISSSSTQSNQSITTIATPAANSEIVTITDGNRVSASETTNAPIHIMQTQVN